MRCAIDDTVEYVKILAQRLGAIDSNCAALVILLDLGIPVNFDGFEYLKTAILLQYEDPMRDLVNDIYPLIAASCGKYVSNDMIEISIRGAIKAAWNRTDLDVWQKYLPTIDYSKNRQPKNAEVIAGLSRILELWQACAKAYMRQQIREEVSCGIE